MHVWPVGIIHLRANRHATRAQLHPMSCAPSRNRGKWRLSTRWLYLCVSTWAYFAGIGRCHASPPNLAVSVNAADGAHDCADRSQLVEKIQKTWPRVAVVPRCDPECLQVFVQFKRIEQHYQAKLEFRGLKPGERLLSDDNHDCTALEDAVAVAIGLLLDSELDPSRAAAQPSAEHAAPTLKISHGSIELGPPAPSRSFWSGSLQLGGEFGMGVVPATSLGLALARQSRGGWRLQTTALVWLPTTTTYANGQVDVSLLAGTLAVCRLWGKSWQLGPCVAAGAGRWHGTGRGYSESLAANLRWTAGGGALLFEGPIGRQLTLGLEGSAWLPTSQARFSVEPLGTAWNSPHIWIGLATRLGVRFR